MELRGAFSATLPAGSRSVEKDPAQATGQSGMPGNPRNWVYKSKHPASRVSQASKALWCGREDSNFHGLPRYHLKVVRLPIPPRPHHGFEAPHIANPRRLNKGHLSAWPFRMRQESSHKEQNRRSANFPEHISALGARGTNRGRPRRQARNDGRPEGAGKPNERGGRQGRETPETLSRKPGIEVPTRPVRHRGQTRPRPHFR